MRQFGNGSNVLLDDPVGHGLADEKSVTAAGGLPSVSDSRRDRAR
jgi:hypothetical protein